MSAFYFSQIFMSLFYLFYALTYVTKKRHTILVLNTFGQVMFSLANFFLGAYSAVFMSIIAGVRNLLFLAFGHKTTDPTKMSIYDIGIFSVVAIYAVISGWFTVYNFWSVLPMIATVGYSFSICQKNIKLYRLMGTPIAVIWAVFNVYTMNVVGMIGQSFLSFFIFYSYMKIRREEKLAEHLVI